MHSSFGKTRIDLVKHGHGLNEVTDGNGDRSKQNSRTSQFVGSHQYCAVRCTLLIKIALDNTANRWTTLDNGALNHRDITSHGRDGARTNSESCCGSKVYKMSYTCKRHGTSGKTNSVSSKLRLPHTNRTLPEILRCVL
jgi:hypothetical protein